MATVPGLRRLFMDCGPVTSYDRDCRSVEFAGESSLCQCQSQAAPRVRTRGSGRTSEGESLRTRYADTLEEITRIQRRPPPMAPVPLMNGTLVSRAWENDPIHDDVAPMEHHVIAPTLRGDGRSTVRFGSKMIMSPSFRGGVTIAPRGFGGRYHSDGRPLASNVFLSRHRLQRCADELQGGRPPELLPRLNFNDERLFSILSLISSEAEQPGPHDRLYVELLIDLLCLQLLREHSAFPITGGYARGGLRSWQVTRITKYMQEHLDEPIALQELADLLGLSRFHFCTAFRRATGRTPHQWLLELRMGRARQLLAEGRLTITDVAMAVGYQTPSAFTHAFRSFFGLPPREFRRRL